MTSSAIQKILISVATYRRADDLGRLLESLDQEVRTSIYAVRVVVVDNDPQQSAEATVGRFPHLSIYDPEPLPGIVSARNRGLTHRQDADAVIFVDDDEYVSSGWLSALVMKAESSGAGVVAGPVTPIFPSGTPSWLVRQGWYERKSYDDGEFPKWPATNNSLVRAAELEKLGENPFDEKFSFTGGSDADLFERLRSSGTQFIWAAEAEVLEPIPPSRLTPQWLWRRNVRLGNVSAIFLCRRHSVFAVFGVGLARIAVGAICAPMVAVLNIKGGARWACHLPRGIGIIGNLFGRNVVEYARLKEKVS